MRVESKKEKSKPLAWPRTMQDEIFPLSKCEMQRQCDYPGINWEEVLGSWQSKEMQTKYFSLFSNSFFSQFLEGLQHEYGINRPVNGQRALEIYRTAAEGQVDILSMYKMFSIHLHEYKKFKIKPSINLEKYYLFKAYAYAHFEIIKEEKKFMNYFFLSIHIKIHMFREDPDLLYAVQLMEAGSNSSKKEKKIEFFIIQSMLLYGKSLGQDEPPFSLSEYETRLKKSKMENVIYEDEFYYKYACGVKDKAKKRLYFDKCYSNKYYKAYEDFGIFGFNECADYKTALIVFKEGMDNGNTLCYENYYSTYLKINSSTLLAEATFKEENMILLLDLIIINIYLREMRNFISDFFYMINYGTKHFNMGKTILLKYKPLIVHGVALIKTIVTQRNFFYDTELSHSDGYVMLRIIDGFLIYRGIEGVVKKNLNKALEIFNDSYEEALKENMALYLKTIGYGKIFQVKRKGFKQKKISEESYLKACRKFFNWKLSREETDEKLYANSFSLGKCYEGGIGTKKDLMIAKHYYLSSLPKTEEGTIEKYHIYQGYRDYKVHKKLEKEIFKKCSLGKVVTPGVKEEENETSEDEICCICGETKVNVLLIPCKHKICKECGKNVKAIKSVCPMCRRNVINELIFGENEIEK